MACRRMLPDAFRRCAAFAMLLRYAAGFLDAFACRLMPLPPPDTLIAAANIISSFSHAISFTIWLMLFFH
jgi:hypothetical protein